MKKLDYVLYWLDGKKETIRGSTVSEAFNRAGLSKGALGALDFYSLKKNEKYWKWDSEKEKWIHILLEKKDEEVGMCCGTPLRNNKCPVCGDNFNNI